MFSFSAVSATVGSASFVPPGTVDCVGNVLDRISPAYANATGTITLEKRTAFEKKSHNEIAVKTSIRDYYDQR